MSPLRLSTGKAVNPLRRPKLATARGLRLSPVAIEEVEPGGRLPLAPSEGPQSVGVITVHEAGDGSRIGPIEAPPLLLKGELLSAPKIEPPSLAEWRDPAIAGGFFPGEEDLATTSVAPPWVQLLWPRLSRPYYSPDREETAYGATLHLHQREVIAELVQQQALLLADDPYTGKAVSLCLALGQLLQAGIIGRALLLAPASRQRYWLETLRRWTPGVLVSRIHGSRGDARRLWAQPAHLIVSDYSRAADELPHRAQESSFAPIDLVIADSVLSAIHKTPRGLRVAVDLEAPRCWALSGGMPENAEDWRTLFGYLMPGQPIGRNEPAVELQERLSTHVMRRSKRLLADALPARQRHELWLELDSRQSEAYRTSWAEERHMLRQLGEAVSSTHITSSLGELNREMAFAQGSLDGVKVRALADLLESVAAADDKVVLFSQYRHRALEPLRQALHAYGALTLPSGVNETERSQILATFRRDPKRRVLLAHLDARADGEPMPASYIVHFDVVWNAARRVRAEQRFFPEMKPDLPLTILEFWMAGTHEEALHAFLERMGMLAGDLPLGTRPAELEDRMTVEDWRRSVFETFTESGERGAAIEIGTTGLLPGTSDLRATLLELSEPELVEAVEVLMEALGFPQTERVESEEGEAVDLLARSGAAGEQALVRVLATEDNVGVADGRALLAALQDQPQAAAAYLVTTSDFTSACKTLADESGGELALVSGSEFYRHLRILRWL